MIVDLSLLSLQHKQAWLQHAIAPRPIALASTIDAAGNVNLSPFSFFNLFSIDPPVVIFSPSRRVRDNTTKHTLQNIEQVREVVINICDFDMVHQTSLSSCDYPKTTDEFIKAGFTKSPASMVKPPLVKESKIQLECRVNEIIQLGTGAGAGMLVVAEVLCLHADPGILNNEQTMISQTRIKHVARLGDDWYMKVDERSLFRIQKPHAQTGIGFDALPTHIRNSKVLTGNHLAMLAGVASIPAADPGFKDENMVLIQSMLKGEMVTNPAHAYVISLLDYGKTYEAWQVLLSIAP